MKNSKLLFILSTSFLVLFTKIGFSQTPSFENKVWAADCSKQFPARAWIRSGKDFNSYLYLEPKKFSKDKVNNVSSKGSTILFNYENSNETYVFEKNKALVKTRVISGEVIVENSIYVKTNTPMPTLYPCEQDSVAAIAFPKKAEEAIQVQASSSSQCFSSMSAWRNSPDGREQAAIAQPMRQKLPEAQANPYAVDPVFWRDSIKITNSLLIKSQNTQFCNANDQREFNGIRNGLVEWRDHASELLRLWKNVETSYEKSIQGLNCPAYKEAQYKCATAGNPAHCIKVLFPAVNEMYANCR